MACGISKVKTDIALEADSVLQTIAFGSAGENTVAPAAQWSLRIAAALLHSPLAPSQAGGPCIRRANTIRHGAVERGTITRTATATGTVNPVLTIIVGAYESASSEHLLRLRHAGARGAGTAPRLNRALSGSVRSIYRPARARSGGTRRGARRSRTLSKIWPSKTR